MRRFLFVLLLFAAGQHARAQNAAAQQEIQAPVLRFFDAMAAGTEKAVAAEAAPGFSLLENGKVWNIDSLVNSVSKYKGMGITRINRLDFISTEQSGNLAWVSYYNTADLTYKGRQIIMKWLESALLIREKRQWKIKLLHSTELKPAAAVAKKNQE